MGKGHSEHSKYAYHAPYPEIKVRGLNPLYAELLMDDYAGVVSEFTAISQYLYHHQVLAKDYEKIAKLLEGVSIVEMHHMEMLAEIIIKLGGDPRIRGSYSTCRAYWNGSFVDYGKGVDEQLRADIDSETKAIKTYQMRIMQIQDPYIQAVLKRIILDEEHHLKLFKQALKKL